jgi:hypothetical protein
MERPNYSIIKTTEKVYCGTGRGPFGRGRVSTYRKMVVYVITRNEDGHVFKKYAGSYAGWKKSIKAKGKTFEIRDLLKGE